VAKRIRFRRYELTGYQNEIKVGNNEEVVLIDPNGSHLGEFAPDHRPILVFTAESQEVPDAAHG